MAQYQKLQPPEPNTSSLLVREFHLNGFAILRNFLPLDYVAALQEQLEPILVGEFTLAETSGWKDARDRGRISVHLETYSKLLGGALGDDRYLRNPAIESLVDEVMGEGNWERGWSVVEAVRSGSRHMTWHSDQKIEETPDPDAPHETIRMTYNIPLVDFTWASGAMEVIPGSHRLPRRFLDSSDFAKIPNLFPVRLDLRLGDVVVRDGNALHRGTPNLLDQPRPMLDQTYKKRVG